MKNSTKYTQIEQQLQKLGQFITKYLYEQYQFFQKNTLIIQKRSHVVMGSTTYQRMHRNSIQTIASSNDEIFRF